MAEKPNSKTNPFEVETIRDLVRLMSKHGLSELDLQDGEKKIRLKKEGLGVPTFGRNHCSCCSTCCQQEPD